MPARLTQNAAACRLVQTREFATPEFMQTQHLAPAIEILESRIAPATLSGQVVTYTDLDGDTVSIMFSTGTLAKSQFTFANSSAFDDTTPQQLQTIDIHGLAGFAGADITVTVKPAASGGDGLTAIGYINATGVDLGKVSVAGDLSEIDAGTDAASNVAIKALSVFSMNLYSNATDPAKSEIKGSLGSLTVKTDVTHAEIKVTDSMAAANGKIGVISIGGFITSGSVIQADGGIASLKIGASIMNGSSITAGTGIGPITVGLDVTNSSSIKATMGDIGNISVHGSVNNGSGIDSTAGGMGNIKVGGGVHSGGHIGSLKKMGTVTVTGSVRDGGSIGTLGSIGAVKVGNMSGGGQIAGAMGVASVTIGDYLINGASVTSAMGSIGPVKIGGNVTGGGTVSGSTGVGPVTIGGNLGAGGTMASAAGKIASVKVRIGVLAGGAISGHLGVGAVSVGGDFGGAITSDAGSVAAVKIKGNVSGGIGGDTGVAAVTVGGGGSLGISSNNGTVGAVKVGASLSGMILAKTGITSLSVGDDLNGSTITSNVGPIGPIKVGLNMVSSFVFGASSVKSVSVGGNVSSSGIFAGVIGTPVDATIGAITVGGNWVASSVSAGVTDVSVDGYGNMDDTLIATGISKITSIVIKGAVIGSAALGNDRFAFEAASIGSFKINGISVLGALNPQPLSPYTGDVSIRLFPM
jgi:hypothetical protein